jgi:VWFA-related protein
MQQGYPRLGNSRPRRGAIWLALGVMLLVLPGFSRKPAAVFQSPQGVLRVTTQLVQVNVIVKDRHGQLVPGLTSQDFSVFDDGKPQKISIFRVEATRPSAAAWPKLPPHTFSNMPERHAGASPAVTVILLDALNTPWSSQAQARLQVLKFLQQLRPGDPVALYALGGDLRVLHDFTTDASVLIAALARYRGRPATELEASDPSNWDTSGGMVEPSQLDEASSSDSGSTGSQDAAALQQWLTGSTNYAAEYYMNQRVRKTVDALVAIANHLEGLPGRKNLIWVSGGFPLLNGLDRMLQPGGIDNVRNYGGEVSRAAQALNNVNLAVYPVDARGLMVMPEFSAARRNLPVGRFTDLTANFGAMDEIAQRTGGRAFYNTNDIKGALRKVIDDSRLTYVLGYYPAHGKWNGEYRKLKVQVDRRGLKLQYRRGYLASPVEPPSTPTVRQAMAAAVFSPLDATGVGFVVRAVPVPTKPGGPEVLRLLYKIDAHDITFTPQGKAWTGRVTVTIVELGPRGMNLKGKSYRADFKLNPQTREKYLAAGIGAMELFEMVPGGDRVRVVVRDDTSNQIGSLTIPLDRVLGQPGG